MADVVPVAEICDAHAVEPAEPLPDRHHVGQRLARMEVVGEPVDDRDVRGGGELVHVGLREGADHDPVEVAGENGARVLDRLAAPELQVAGREVERGAPQLEHPHLEADARPRRGLLKDHPERPALEVAVLDALALARFQPVGEVEDADQLVRVPVVHAQEVPPLELRRDHAGILGGRDDAGARVSGRERLGARDERLSARLADEAERGLHLRAHAARGERVDQPVVAAGDELLDCLLLVGAEARVDRGHLGEDDEPLGAELDGEERGGVVLVDDGVDTVVAPVSGDDGDPPAADGDDQRRRSRGAS